jgi:hypothetical protein
VTNFGDDFIRADGPLGSNWIEADTGPSEGPLVIDNDAAVASAVSTSWGYFSFYVEPVTGDYTTDVQISQMNAEVGANQLYSVLVAFDIATFTGLEWSYVTSTSSPGDGNLRRNTWVDGVQTASSIQDHVDTPVTLRVEKVGDNYRFWYLAFGTTDFVLVDDSDWPEFAAGDHVGMRADWQSPALDSPWIDGFAVTGPSPLTDFCDDFERADGPLGAQWANGSAWGGDYTDALTIVSNAAETGGGEVKANMYYTTALGPSQTVEVELEQLWQGAGADVGTGHYVMLATNRTNNGDEQMFADFNFSDDGSSGSPGGAGFISITCGQMDVDGNINTDTSVTVPMITFPVSMVVTMATDAAGVTVISFDGVVRLTHTPPDFVPGQYVMIGTASGDHLGTITQFVPSVRFLSMCAIETVTDVKVRVWDGSAWVDCRVGPP